MVEWSSAMEFKDKLKSLRQEAGLSQEGLADAIHVSRSAIAKYENGNGKPSEETLNALAFYFGVEVSALKDDETIKKDHKKKTLLIVGLVSLGVLLTAGTATGISYGVFLYQRNQLERANKSNSIDQTSRYISYSINADYGLHVQDRVTLLLGDSIIPFNSKDYGIDKIILGDYLTIEYKGTWMVMQTYPSQVNTRDLEIINVTSFHGTIIEFEQTENLDGEKSLKATNPDITYGQFLTNNCINADGSFSDISSYPVGTIIYGVNPANFSSLNIVGFYSYNPLS